MINRIDWELTYAAYYVVSPKKGKNNTLFSPEVTGNEILPKLIPEVLKKFFLKNPNAYPVGISFCSTDGAKTNEIRNFIRDLALGDKNVRDNAAHELAIRLCHSMDLKSNSGLLIILCGEIGNLKRVVIWKFPKEIILYPTEGSVTQIDEAYATEYGYVKAVVYQDEESKEAFWKGRVEDKENSSIIKQAASFWINDFLKSQTEITDGMGTKILSGIIRESIDQSKSLDEKNQIIISYQAFRNKENKNISINDFINTYLPPKIAQKMIQKTQKDKYLDTKFNLIASEANKIIGYESLELDNGIIITGPDHAMREYVKMDNGSTQQIVITGKVYNKRLRANVK